MTQSQYLNEHQLSAEFGDLAINNVTLISQDTYNEMELLKAVKKTGMVGELLACTIQIAVVGFGGKSYGHVNYKGSDLDVKSVFNKCHVNLVSELNKKLKDGELTPRRLIRLFRFQIQKFIKTSGKKSYLARKYYDGDEQYEEYIYPGAESIITNPEHAKALLSAYEILDKRLGTHISERIKRVFSARLVKF
jgi:hypothetical protein